MKKQTSALRLRKTTIRVLSSRELFVAAGGLFEDERLTWDLTQAGVSGPEPKASDTCSWGCSHTCSNYATCA